MRQTQFWDDAALEVCGAVFATSTDNPTSIKDLRKQYDQFADLYFDNHAGAEFAKPVERQWSLLASQAIRLSRQLSTPLTVDSVTTTLISKQRDYGHENIRRFGRNGLIMRCHDKVARLENLSGADFEPSNESIADTLLDIVGYSVIGIMWEQELFLLPLAPPRNVPELLANRKETR